MKYKWSVAALLLGMFLLTQIIGLAVIHYYDSTDLPMGLQPTEEEKNDMSLGSIIISFVLAFMIIFLLMKYKLRTVMRLWFLFVISLALIISLNAIIGNSNPLSVPLSIIVLGVVLAIFKIFRPGVIIHNVTELLIYPGIAAIFVTFLNPLTVIGLLVVISIYDMWAVWKVGIMQKMAKFQMEELKVFGGFLLPLTDKKTSSKIKKIKQKYKGKRIPKRIQEKKFKINLAILGGGDAVFPLIAAGVFYKYFGLTPAIFIVVGGFVGLSYLFYKSQKDKAYPAMPYISLGVFLAMLIWELIF